MSEKIWGVDIDSKTFGLVKGKEWRAMNYDGEDRGSRQVEWYEGNMNRELLWRMIQLVL